MLLEPSSLAEAEPSEHVLVLTRLYDAPRSLLFKLWTDPKHVVRWWGPRDFTTTSCAIDARPGGQFRICICAPDGTEHWMRGTYREIVAPERLVFTFAWENETGAPGHETLVTVQFAERGQRTELTFRQAFFETRESRDSHASGWSECLDRLEQYLAAGVGT